MSKIFDMATETENIAIELERVECVLKVAMKWIEQKRPKKIEASTIGMSDWIDECCCLIESAKNTTSTSAKKIGKIADELYEQLKPQEVAE